jgi:hypothetical protein
MELSFAFEECLHSTTTNIKLANMSLAEGTLDLNHVVGKASTDEMVVDFKHYIIHYTLQLNSK